MTRRLRFSERKHLDETGSLGDLVEDTVPQSLRGAFAHFLAHEKTSTVSQFVDRELNRLMGRHYGHTNLSTLIASGDVGEFLDLCEIVLEVAPNRYRWASNFYAGIPNAEATLNQIFDRHRFGYQFENGQARPISSPALSIEVIGPALLAVRRPGWESVEEAFRQAVQHLRRADETADAITSASSAVEAALKGLELKGQPFRGSRRTSRNPTRCAGT
jgi:hypothetical protein